MPLTFLDLPLATRLRIYTNAGLIRYCPIDLAAPKRSTVMVPDGSKAWNGATSFANGLGVKFADGTASAISHDCWMVSETGEKRTEGENEHFHPVNCFCPDLPISLLFVSREIHKETLSILIGCNKFVLRAHDSHDLALLQGMSHDSLASMTSLLVRLNCWPCPRGHNAGENSQDECIVCGTPTSQADSVLDASTPEGQDLIQRWILICEKLALAIPPGQLCLTFICDVKDLSTAKKITRPLLTLPTLQRCTVRLGRERNHHLRALAEVTSQKMTKAVLPILDKPFPFERLPREIRHQILNYTHLTAPEVVSVYEGKVDGRELYHNSMACCWKCTDTFADCCCPRWYASYSDSCVCREFPLLAFSLSKQAYEDVNYIFYSKVCFELQSDPMASLKFLKELPPRALKIIRRLRFLFTEGDLAHWKDSSYTQKWQDLVSFIKQNFEVPRLSIEIDTSHGANDLCLFLQNEEQTRFLYDIYWDITSALKVIPELEDLYFNNGWFIDLGPLLAKEVIGERYKERPVAAPSHKLKRQWAVPAWWSDKSL